MNNKKNIITNESNILLILFTKIQLAVLMSNDESTISSSVTQEDFAKILEDNNNN